MSEFSEERDGWLYSCRRGYRHTRWKWESPCEPVKGEILKMLNVGGTPVTLREGDGDPKKMYAIQLASVGKSHGKVGDSSRGRSDLWLNRESKTRS